MKYLLRAILAAAALAGAASAQQPAAAPATLSPAAAVTNVTHSIDYSQSNLERLLVTIRLTLDPDTQIINVPRIVRADKALDSLGNSLVMTDPIPASLHPEQIAFASGPNVQILLQPTAITGPRAPSIALIEGAIPAELAKTDHTPIAVPGTLDRDIAGVHETCRATMPNTNSCRFAFTFDRPTGMSDEQWKLWQPRVNMVMKVNITGGDLSWNTMSASGTTNASQIIRTMTYTGNPSPANRVPGPLNATIDLITETKPVLIHYHLENIPLP